MSLTDSDVEYIKTASTEELRELFRAVSKPLCGPVDTEYASAIGREILQRADRQRGEEPQK